MKNNNNLINLLDQAVNRQAVANFNHNNDILAIQDHTIPNNLIADLDHSDLQDLALNLLLNHWNIDHIEQYDSFKHMEEYKGDDYDIVTMQDVDYMEVIDVLIGPLSNHISNHINNVKNDGFLTHYDRIAMILGESYHSINIYLIDGLYTIVEDM